MDLPDDMPEELKDILRQLGEASGAEVHIARASSLSEMMDKEEEIVWPTMDARLASSNEDQVEVETHFTKSLKSGDFFYIHGKGHEPAFTGWITDDSEATEDAMGCSERREMNYLPTKSYTNKEIEPVQRWLYRPAMVPLTTEQFEESKTYMELGFPSDVPTWLTDLHDAMEHERIANGNGKYAERVACESCGSLWGTGMVISERSYRFGAPIKQDGKWIVVNPDRATPAVVQSFGKPDASFDKEAIIFCRACGHVQELDVDTVCIDD